MRANAASAPRLRSSSPASSAESCAASCCARSRLARNPATDRCSSSIPLQRSDARPPAGSIPRAAVPATFPSHAAHRGSARSPASTPAAADPAAALPFPSDAAPRSDSRSRARQRAALPIFASSVCVRSASVFRQMPLHAFPPGPAPARSSASFCWLSRSSRFSASGPSAPGLPPVTVTLWKHSPVGARKNALGFSSASVRAVSESGATITLAQLRQNHFQRPPKSIQHANAVPQRNNRLHRVVVRSPYRRPQRRTSPASLPDAPGTSRAHPHPSSATEPLRSPNPSFSPRCNSARPARIRRPRSHIRH